MNESLWRELHAIFDRRTNESRSTGHKERLSNGSLRPSLSANALNKFWGAQKKNAPKRRIFTNNLAEAVRFELTEGANPRRFSRPVP